MKNLVNIQVAQPQDQPDFVPNAICVFITN